MDKKTRQQNEFIRFAEDYQQLDERGKAVINFVIFRALAGKAFRQPNQENIALAVNLFFGLVWDDIKHKVIMAALSLAFIIAWALTFWR